MAGVMAVTNYLKEIPGLRGNRSLLSGLISVGSFGPSQARPVVHLHLVNEIRPKPRLLHYFGKLNLVDCATSSTTVFLRNLQILSGE